MNEKSRRKTTFKPKILSISDALDAMGWTSATTLFLIAGISMWVVAAFNVLYQSFVLTALSIDINPAGEAAQKWRLTAWDRAVVGSASAFGMAIGGWAYGALVDRIGRRLAAALSMAMTFLGPIMTVISTSRTMLIIMRTLVGAMLSFGTIPVQLITEHTPSKSRGTASSGFQVAWAAGAILGVVMAAYTLPNDRGGWHALSFVTFFASIVLGAIVFFVPPSPRFLSLIGQPRLARATLNKWAKNSGVRQRLPGSWVLPEEAQDSKAQVPQERGSSRLLFSTPALTRTTLLLFGLYLCNSSLYYGMWFMSVDLFAGDDNDPSIDAPHGPDNPQMYWDIAIANAAEVPGMIICTLLIDRLGRRWTSALSMSSLFFGSIMLSFKAIAPHWFLLLAAILVRAGAIAAYAVVLIYSLEAYPANMRGIAGGVHTLVAKMGMTLTPFLANYLLAVNLPLTMFIYAGIAAVGFTISLMLVETSGVPLSDGIDHDADPNKSQDEEAALLAPSS